MMEKFLVAEGTEVPSLKMATNKYEEALNEAIMNAYKLDACIKDTYHDIASVLVSVPLSN